MIITPDNPIQIAPTKSVQFESRALDDKVMGQSTAVKVDVKVIPESFWRGLAACDAGRVVDMERAMNEPPPPAD